MVEGDRGRECSHARPLTPAALRQPGSPKRLTDPTGVGSSAASSAGLLGVGKCPDRHAEGVVQAVARVSSTVPDGAVRLSVTVKVLGGGAREELAPLAEHDRADQQPVLVDEPCGAERLGQLPAAVDNELLAPSLEPRPPDRRRRP